MEGMLHALEHHFSLRQGQISTDNVVSAKGMMSIVKNLQVANKFIEFHTLFHVY